MVVVAVAGGTGNVGRALVDGILATGKHDVKILSRKANPKLEAELGVSIVPVDYSDIEAVAKALDDLNVHTLVSGLATMSMDGTPVREIELVRAAEQSKSVKRLVSSHWEVSGNPLDTYKLDVRKELEKTKTLEWTVFYNGYFMDYWGLPRVPSYLSRMPIVVWVDIPNNVAAIPGTGDKVGVFTHTSDVGRFVAASLDLPKWECETSVWGDRVTWNEVVRMAEEAKGIKFKVTHDSVEDLKAGKSTELPSYASFYDSFPREPFLEFVSKYGLMFEEGVFDHKPEKFLNEDFPEINPMTFKEMIDRAWKRS